jgi:hypothetical protein
MYASDETSQYARSCLRAQAIKATQLNPATQKQASALADRALDSGRT